jgi:hypothetical protein
MDAQVGYLGLGLGELGLLHVQVAVGLSEAGFDVGVSPRNESGGGFSGVLREGQHGGVLVELDTHAAQASKDRGEIHGASGGIRGLRSNSGDLGGVHVDLAANGRELMGVGTEASQEGREKRGGLLLLRERSGELGGGVAELGSNGGEFGGVGTEASQDGREIDRGRRDLDAGVL